ncbi:ArsR family transcriptional regulator [Arthrobacter sp. GAS37]|uniref:ArsR/SmtB family transcription factor n=1 Tax=Arthrobacter sp. GAS37 TaxID=3156261 RepID=UPI003838773B
MPKYVRPSTPAPALTEAAIAMLGINPLRTEIIRYLAQHIDGATSGSIARAIGAEYRTVYGHLRQLVEAGGVLTDGDTGNRKGQWVIYRLNPDAIKMAQDEYRRYTSGN